MLINDRVSSSNPTTILKLEPIDIDLNQVIPLPFVPSTTLETATPSMLQSAGTSKRPRKSAHPSKTIKTPPSCPLTIPEEDLSNLPPSSDHTDEQENHDDESISYPSFPATKRPRLTHDKRLEANARERERVHNLTAAFEALRQVIPMYGDQPKLSRLSILRIACSYVLVLGSLNEIDFSEGQNAYTFHECFHMLSSTILSELKRKKNSPSNPPPHPHCHRHDRIDERLNE